MTRRNIGLLLLGTLLLGVVIGTAVTLVVRRGDGAKRTAPQILTALHASAGDNCPENAHFIAPVRADDGDWYTGCWNNKRYFCYRVKPGTLEVIDLDVGALGTPCNKAPQWPKP